MPELLRQQGESSAAFPTPNPAARNLTLKSLPSGVQIHLILCPASLCCCEVYEQQWLDWDPSSQWTSDDTRGADPPERVLT